MLNILPVLLKNVMVWLKLKNYKVTKNVEIYKMAYEIIEHYFAEEIDDAVIAPAADECNFQFNPNVNMPNEGYKF